MIIQIEAASLLSDKLTGKISSSQKAPAENKPAQTTDTQKTQSQQAEHKQSSKNAPKSLNNDEAVIYEPSASAEPAEESKSKMDLNGDGVVTVYERMKYLQKALLKTSSDNTESGTAQKNNESDPAQAQNIFDVLNTQKALGSYNLN